MATWLAMLTVQTIGSIDSKHKLPAPKMYAAIAVVWGVLFLMADTGFGRAAARLSALILLTAAVIGPFGAKFVKFLDMTAKTFAVNPTSTGQQSASGAQYPVQPEPSLNQPRFS